MCLKNGYKRIHTLFGGKGREGGREREETRESIWLVLTTPSNFLLVHVVLEAPETILKIVVGEHAPEPLIWEYQCILRFLPSDQTLYKTYLVSIEVANGSFSLTITDTTIVCNCEHVCTSIIFLFTQHGQIHSPSLLRLTNM